MKLSIQSGLVLLLFLLCTSSVLAQSFTILTPVSKQFYHVTYVGGQISDSILVKNNTDSIINLSFSIEGIPFGVSVYNSTYTQSSKDTIAANTTKKIYVLIKRDSGSDCPGTITGNLIITDSTVTTTARVGLSIEYRAYIIYPKPPFGTEGIKGQTLCFSYIPIGHKACQSVWVKNFINEPIIIKNIALATNYDDISIAPHATSFPIVVLPGEEIPIADVCFSPSRVNTSIDYNNIYIESVPSFDYNGIDIGFGATSEIDTNLLKPCIVASVDTSLLGPILLNGSIDKKIELRNNRYGPLTLDKINFTFGDQKEFSVIGLPITISPLSSNTITLRFSPQQTDSIVKFRYATGVQFHFAKYPTTDSLGDRYSNCTSTSLNFIGLAMLPTADSIATPLIADKKYVLGMIGTAPSFSQDFHFDNTTTGKIKIVNVSLTNPGSEFSLSNISPSNTMPLTLNPGEKLTVTVQFTPSATNQVFFNQLVITTEAGLQSLTYPIQGMRVGNASVPIVLNGAASLSITPNPVKDLVSINVSNVESSSIEIYDLLGKRVFKMNNATTLSLNVHDLKLQTGVYFVRATGREASGYDFTLTNKLIVK